MEIKVSKFDLWDITVPDTPYYKIDKVRNRINELLFNNARIEASLGKDTTKKEYAKAKIEQEKIFLEIKSLDIELYKVIQPDNESEL